MIILMISVSVLHQLDAVDPEGGCSWNIAQPMILYALHSMN